MCTLSLPGDDFYGETLLEQTRQAGVNVQSCIRLHGHNTSTYLSVANQQEETVLAINDTHILQQLTPQLLNASRDLVMHAGVVLADCNLTEEALSGSSPWRGIFRSSSIRFPSSKPIRFAPGYRAFTR
jgi:pseudouridine kinase